MEALAYTSAECQESDEGVLLGFATFLYIEVGFAIISMLFGFYFFKRVWDRIMRLKDSVGCEPRELEPAPDRKYKMIRIQQHVVKKAFKEIALYDLVVLLYFLISCANLVLNFVVPNAATQMADCPHAANVRALAISFFFVDAVWVPVWYYCCSHRKGVDAEIPWPKEEAKVPGTVVGNSA
eukprot:CAMPEP_0179026484 /NCGR_PEP_ID=MMETSP0796-20121207/8536_1 /TAXON_ID=73915 /ORGANISM="Pyrodinium bahamense, Strain pbaha01" /LENGTH=180 /DNA_ID=CAMNT_0020722561 /DNA_START=233 /DNA_END=775 /DNA_ORIENTATION=+